MGDTTATFEWAFRWLAAHRPAPSPPRLVHGDFRMGNLIVDESGLAAVLDWELVHIGEVVRGPGLVLHPGLAVRRARASRRGRPGQRRELPVRLRAGRGCTRRPRRVSLVADAGHAALGRHLPLPGRAASVRPDPSVELAAIGRRVSETEWDCWICCEGRSEATRERCGAGCYGRPTAAELVAAVADFLDNDVRSSTATEGQVNFHARVAANVLRIVERELIDDSAAMSPALWPNSASPTKRNWPRRSAPGRWTTARTTCCRPCARWSAIGLRLPTPATTNPDQTTPEAPEGTRRGRWPKVFRANAPHRAGSPPAPRPSPGAPPW